MHVGLDHDGLLPAFSTVTDGKSHDISVGRTLELPAESIVVMGRAYNDYEWFNALTKKEVFFATRQKTNALYRVVEHHPVLKKKGPISDQTIGSIGSIGSIGTKECPAPLRRIGYRDPDTGKHYVFLTNNFKLAASPIANIYKARW